jgi:gliding motility-associated-like protein
MKTRYSLFGLIFFLLFVGAVSSSIAQIDTTKNKIVFDISKHNVKNGYVDIEVSVSAIIDVVALDFSLQFTQPKLKFDTIIKNVSYVDELYYYNPVTGILRFTSYALQNYEHNKSLVSIRFLSDSLRIDSVDLFTIKTYLNGDQSGFIVQDSVPDKGNQNVHPNNNIKEHLVCGDQHALALKTNGEVWAWGNNASGQLGNNSNLQSNVPVQVKGLLNNGFLNTAVAVAAGADHSLAILCDGSVVAWGNNNSGQLGDGTHTQSLCPVSVKGLPLGVHAFSIAAGDFHSIAVLEDGSVWTWGGNYDGQLGNNSITEALTAVQVHGILNNGFLTKAFEAAAGGSHSLVLMQDSTLCSFGSNNKGQTGNGTSGNTQLTPVSVLDNATNAPLVNVINTEGGFDHSIAVLSDGSVKTWGSNSNGQLGNGTTTDNTKAISVQGIAAVKTVAAGFAFSAVVLKDSTVWTWGINSYGQLGDNTKGTNRLLPVQMHGIQNVGFLKSALAIATGKEFCVQLLDDHLYGIYSAVGYNASGQLGDKTSISKSAPVYIFGSLVAGIVRAGFSPLTGTAVCFPDGKVTFTSNAPLGSNRIFSWSFGAGATPSTSIVANPGLVTYASAGTKNIKLIISEGPSCYGTWTDTVTQTVNVVSGADASFTSSGPACAAQGINFYSAGSKGSGIIHDWKFDAGSIPSNSADENPVNVIYAKAGAYTITHKVFVPTCSANDSKTMIITVNPSPAASFTSSGSVCASVPVHFTFTGISEPGMTCFWEFGEGALQETSNSQTPNDITYKTSGAKKVRLNAKNILGCTTSVIDTLIIKSTPQINLSSVPTTLCTGTAIGFGNSGDSTGVHFLWNFGASASPLSSANKNPGTVVYATGGIKTLTLSATNDTTNCVASATQNFTVSQLPSADFSVNSSNCAGSKMDFSATNTSISTGSSWIYSWNFGVGAVPSTANIKSVSGVYFSAGKKEITLSVSDGSCSSGKTDTLDFKDKPIADAGKDTSICANKTIKIGSAGISGNSYSWSPSSALNNSFIADPMASPVIGFTQYILTVTNDTSGCVSSDTLLLTATNLVASTGPDATLCRSQKIQIGDSSVSGQSYQWLPAKGLSDPTSSGPFANPDSTTTYTLSVSGFGCPAVSKKVVVLVHQLPVVSLGKNDTIAKGATIQFHVSGGSSYQWIPADGLNDAQISNPIATPQSTTIYTVIVTDNFGCSDSSSRTIAVIPQSFWTPRAFSPDDNGKNDIFYVRGENIQDFSLYIFNELGESIFYSNSIYAGWDGKKQNTGQIMPEGAYVFLIKGTQSDGTAIDSKGLVHLIR